MAYEPVWREFGAGFGSRAKLDHDRPCFAAPPAGIEPATFEGSKAVGRGVPYQCRIARVSYLCCPRRGNVLIARFHAIAIVTSEFATQFSGRENFAVSDVPVGLRDGREVLFCQPPHRPQGRCVVTMRQGRSFRRRTTWRRAFWALRLAWQSVQLKHRQTPPGLALPAHPWRRRIIQRRAKLQ